MTPRVRYARGVNRDYASAVRFYAKVSPVHAQRLIRNFDATIEAIRESPLIGSPDVRNTRWKRVDVYPYRIIYRTDEDGILIVAIAHFSRRPGYWHRRKE